MNTLFGCCCYNYDKVTSITDFENPYHNFNDDDDDNVDKKVQRVKKQTNIAPSGSSPEDFYRAGLRLKAQGDLENAVHNFIQAFKLGHPQAASVLNTTCYDLGMKNKQEGNYAAAFDYFDICVSNAEPGEEDVNALFELGHSHLCGRGTPQNKEEARRLIKMAEAKGHHLAGITLQIMDAPKQGGNVSLKVGDGSIGVSFS